ncbi:MAG: hypothetical protein N3E42_02825 [Candidatus Bipolaricaulota bacterium]|nr:hypothetical protein [Candidatus Bipolaricaulota bacterium]
MGHPVARTLARTLAQDALALSPLQILKRELELSPSQETRALYEQIRKREVAAPASRALHNLPHELTSFIGREREISQIKHLLFSARLLTLTGPGGWGEGVGQGRG